MKSGKGNVATCQRRLVCVRGLGATGAAVPCTQQTVAGLPERMHRGRPAVRNTKTIAGWRAASAFVAVDKEELEALIYVSLAHWALGAPDARTARHVTACNAI